MQDAHSPPIRTYALSRAERRRVFRRSLISTLLLSVFVIAAAAIVQLVSNSLGWGLTGVLSVGTVAPLVAGSFAADLTKLLVSPPRFLHFAAFATAFLLVAALAWSLSI